MQSIKFSVTSTSMSSLPPPDDDIPGSSPPQDKDSSGALHMDDVTLSPPQDKDSSGADASHMDDITLPPWDKDSGASHVDDITLPPRNKDSSGAGALHVDDINLPPQDNDASHVDDVTLEVTKDEDILRQDQDKNTSSGPSHRGNTIPNVPLAPHKNITTIPADPEKDQDPPPPKRRRKHDYTALPKRTTRQNSKAPSWSKRMNAASPLSDQ